MRRAAVAAAIAVAVAATATATGQELAPPAPHVPNDPLHARNRPGLAAMLVPEAWAVTRGSASVTVAIVDSGVVADADLVHNLVPGHNAIDDTTDTTDEHGHGSALAGVAAAGIDNGIGVAGVCGRCTLMPVKISGADDRHRNVTLAEGIDWAVDHGADVVNLARWVDAGLPPNASVNAAIARAVSRGVVVTTIAGNGVDNDLRGTTDPNANVLASSNPQTIRVADFEPLLGTLAPSSNRGSWVDVAATGSLTGVGPTPLVGGTSTAAAAVSGVAGLVLSCNATLAPARVKEILVTTSTSRGLDVVSRGVVNAYAAVVAAGCAAPGPASHRVIVSTSGHGMVVRAPSSREYVHGTRVTFTAKPSRGWRFTSWRGLCRVKRAVCRLTITRPGTVHAVLARR